jgi:phosphoenolpyruvate-protein phosphotransferase/dihydroxyacetone kinase phosphotransfer subunit
MTMIGIVVVSHSPQLAQAALDLALEMVPANPPRVAIAAGTGDGLTGTDAVRVSEAIAEVSSPEGVLVLMDLGSAVLSAEMSLEFMDDPAIKVRLTSAPFVEGLLASVVMAASGASLDDVEREARGALFAKQSQLGEESASEISAVHADAPGSGPSADLTIVNTDGIHARPAALIVGALSGLDAALTVENLARPGKAVAVTGPIALLAIGGRQGQTVRFSTTGPDANALLVRVTELVETGFGESTKPAVEVVAPRSELQSGPIGVSSGRVAGPVARMSEPVAEPPRAAALEAGLREGEAARIPDAASVVVAELRARSAAANATSREILDASAEIAADRGILDEAREQVLLIGTTAERAIWDAFTDRVESLTAQGGRIAERAADLKDARARLVAALQGRPAPGLPTQSDPYILIAHDLAPADTALLDPALCLALVTEEGGPTSHTAILARSLGIPAVVAAPGVWSSPRGDTILVDGTTGELIWDPSTAEIDALAAAPALRPFSGHGATADGRGVPLLANVGSPAGAKQAADARAEGIGLFRTEYCFLDRDVAPTVDEQVETYRAVLSHFGGRKVVIRTLDAGADKPLAFITLHEDNPALGIRGYRTSWRRPELLDDQLTAIARAAELESAQVSVMAPMISTLDEASHFVALCRERGIQSAGVMIETPAAALLADRLLPIVDFVSLGTNDLAQYTMAADRLVGDLATLNDAWQPAVLTLIANVGAAGRATGTPVGVCGEAAADPLLSTVLVGAGATSLSMSPRALAGVADRLARASFDLCREAAQAATGAANPRDARAAAQALLASASPEPMRPSDRMRRLAARGGA